MFAIKRTMIGTFIDIGFVVIILIAFFVGVGEGFSKQFSRPLCGLIAIFGALALTIVLHTIISPLEFYVGFEEKAAGWFTAEFYTQQATDSESLAAILSGGYLRILTSSAEMIWDKMQAVGATTLNVYFGKLAVKVISEFVMWLVLYLTIKYLLLGIKYLMCKISRVVVFKSIDRIFGIVWSLALTYIILISITLTVGELVLNKFFVDIADMVADYLSQTGIASFFHNTNVIGSFISDLLGWPLLPNL